MRGAAARVVTRVRNKVPAGMKKQLSNWKWAAYIGIGLLVWLMYRGFLNLDMVKASFQGTKQAPNLNPATPPNE